MKKKLSNIRRGFIAFAVAALAVVGILPASAQTNMPDASVIYTGLAAPFNSALSWVIAAISVLVLIGWIVKAVSKRKG